MPAQELSAAVLTGRGSQVLYQGFTEVVAEDCDINNFFVLNLPLDESFCYDAKKWSDGRMIYKEILRIWSTMVQSNRIGRLYRDENGNLDHFLCRKGVRKFQVLSELLTGETKERIVGLRLWFICHDATIDVAKLAAAIILDRDPTVDLDPAHNAQQQQQAAVQQQPPGQLIQQQQPPPAQPYVQQQQHNNQQNNRRKATGKFTQNELPNPVKKMSYANLEEFVKSTCNELIHGAKNDIDFTLHGTDWFYKKALTSLDVETLGEHENSFRTMFGAKFYGMHNGTTLVNKDQRNIRKYFNLQTKKMNASWFQTLTKEQRLIEIDPAHFKPELFFDSQSTVELPHLYLKRCTEFEERLKTEMPSEVVLAAMNAQDRTDMINSVNDRLNREVFSDLQTISQQAVGSQASALESFRLRNDFQMLRWKSAQSMEKLRARKERENMDNKTWNALMKNYWEQTDQEFWNCLQKSDNIGPVAPHLRKWLNSMPEKERIQWQFSTAPNISSYGNLLAVKLLELDDAKTKTSHRLMFAMESVRKAAAYFQFGKLKTHLAVFGGAATGKSNALKEDQARAPDVLFKNFSHLTPKALATEEELYDLHLGSHEAPRFIWGGSGKRDGKSEEGDPIFKDALIEGYSSSITFATDENGRRRATHALSRMTFTSTLISNETPPQKGDAITDRFMWWMMPGKVDRFDQSDFSNINIGSNTKAQRDRERILHRRKLDATYSFIFQKYFEATGLTINDLVGEIIQDRFFSSFKEEHAFEMPGRRSKDQHAMICLQQTLDHITYLLTASEFNMDYWLKDKTDLTSIRAMDYRIFSRFRPLLYTRVEHMVFTLTLLEPVWSPRIALEVIREAAKMFAKYDLNIGPDQQLPGVKYSRDIDNRPNDKYVGIIGTTKYQIAKNISATVKNNTQNPENVMQILNTLSNLMIRSGGEVLPAVKFDPKIDGNQCQYSILIDPLLKPSSFEDAMIRALESLGSMASQPIRCLTALPMVKDGRTYFNAFRPVDISPSRELKSVVNPYSRSQVQEMMLFNTGEKNDSQRRAKYSNPLSLEWLQMPGIVLDIDEQTVAWAVNARELGLDETDEYVSRCEPYSVDRYIWTQRKTDPIFEKLQLTSNIHYPRDLINAVDAAHEYRTVLRKGLDVTALWAANTSEENYKEKDMIPMVSDLLAPGRSFEQRRDDLARSLFGKDKWSPDIKVDKELIASRTTELKSMEAEREEELIISVEPSIVELYDVERPKTLTGLSSFLLTKRKSSDEESSQQKKTKKKQQSEPTTKKQKVSKKDRLKAFASLDEEQENENENE